MNHTKPLETIFEEMSTEIRNREEELEILEYTRYVLGKQLEGNQMEGNPVGKKEQETSVVPIPSDKWDTCTGVANPDISPLPEGVFEFDDRTETAEALRKRHDSDPANYGYHAEGDYGIYPETPLPPLHIGNRMHVSLKKGKHNRWTEVETSAVASAGSAVESVTMYRERIDSRRSDDAIKAHWYDDRNRNRKKVMEAQ